MSNPDSFIEEVNEEVRRDRLYGYLRRYGWIAALAIFLIVGGAAFSEFRKAQAKSQAEALGDAMLAALAENADGDRPQALAAVEATNPGARAVLEMLRAGELIAAGDSAAASDALQQVAVMADVPEVYRQLAQFKALTLPDTGMSEPDRRQALEAIAVPGNPFRLLAREQLALAELDAGNRDAAMEGYQALLTDAETTPDLQQRALQVIVALGGEPELSDVLNMTDDALSETE